MKNAISVTGIFIVLTLAFFSCKKGDSFDCAAQVAKIAVAGNLYFSDDSEANCRSYKEALKTYLDKGCEDSGGTYQDAYDNIKNVCP